MDDGNDEYDADAKVNLMTMMRMNMKMRRTNEDDTDDEDNGDEFYKSSLFNDDNVDSIGDAAYQNPSAKRAGVGVNQILVIQRNPTLRVCPKRKQTKHYVSGRRVGSMKIEGRMHVRRCGARVGG